MGAKDFFHLGIFTKTHGLKGDLILQLDTDQPDYFSDLSSVFIDQNGLKTPFFVSSSKLLPNHRLSIRFEDFYSIRDAEHLIGKKAFLPLNLLPELSGSQFYYHEVVGFEVRTTANEFLGIIRNIRDDVQPALFDIYKEGKSILIPVIDPFIERVSQEEKQILLKLPEGTTDLYA